MMNHVQEKIFRIIQCTWKRVGPQVINNLVMALPLDIEALQLGFGMNVPFRKNSNSAQSGRFALILRSLVKGSFFCVF